MTYKEAGAEHRSTLVTAGNLADTLLKEKKYAKAEQVLRQTLAIEERTLGKDHTDTLMSKLVLGDVLTDEGQYPEAEKVLREGYDSSLRAVGKDHEYTGQAAYYLAELNAAEAKKADALNGLTSAIDHGLTNEDDPGTDPVSNPCKAAPRLRPLSRASVQKSRRPQSQLLRCRRRRNASQARERRCVEMPAQFTGYLSDPRWKFAQT